MFIHGLDALDDIRAKEVAMLTSHIPASSTESSYRTRGLPAAEIFYVVQNDIFPLLFYEQIDKLKLTIQQGFDKLEMLKKTLMEEYFG